MVNVLSFLYEIETASRYKLAKAHDIYSGLAAVEADAATGRCHFLALDGLPRVRFGGGGVAGVLLTGGVYLDAHTLAAQKNPRRYPQPQARHRRQRQQALQIRPLACRPRPPLPPLLLLLLRLLLLPLLLRLLLLLLQVLVSRLWSRLLRPSNEQGTLQRLSAAYECLSSRATLSRMC